MLLLQKYNNQHKKQKIIMKNYKKPISTAYIA